MPAIRFAGFTDAWEQRKVGDHLSVSRILGHTGLDAKKLTVKLWGKGVVEKIDIYGGSEHTQYYIRRAGQFMYGKLDFLHAAFGIVPENLDKYESTLDSPAFDLEGIDGRFLLNRVTQEDFFLKYGMIANGSRKAKRIHEDTFLAMPITVPSYEEQVNIGAFFSSLDDLITLHQRKYDALVKVKKAMLEKMFPKGDAKIPEIRFAGFTDAWEQRKLKEKADKVTEKNADLAVQETLTNSAEFGIISQRDFFDHDISNADNIGGYYVVRDDDFVYNPRISMTAPVGPVNRNKLGRNGVMSPLYTVFRTHDIDATYLEWFFKSDCWHPFMYFNGDSGARSDRFSIKDDVFFEMPIPVPSLEEQQKIGVWMDELDNLITLHQRKLERLKNIKKAMLQKMFV